MIAKPGYTVAYVRAGRDLVQAVVKSVHYTTVFDQTEDAYHYVLEDGTKILAESCVVTGFSDEDNCLLCRALQLYVEHLATANIGRDLMLRAQQLRGALDYDRANSDRLRGIPIPNAASEEAG